MGKRIRKGIIYFLLISASIVVLFPLLWMVLISIRNNNEVFTIQTRVIPRVPNVDAFRAIIRNPEMVRLFINSYIVAIAVTVISLFLASISGYGLSRFKFAGKKFVILYLLLTQMFPMVLLSVPYFMTISKLGLYNTHSALTMAYISFALPFSTLMMRDFISTIPVEIDEAAIVDGCGRLKVFWQIVLPPSLPGLIATGVYTFILAWNEFLFATVLTQDITARTLPVGIGMLIGQYTTQYNQMMALSVLASIPLVICFLFVQKYLIQGLTAGSVKI